MRKIPPKVLLQLDYLVSNSTLSYLILEMFVVHFCPHVTHFLFGNPLKQSFLVRHQQIRLPQLQRSSSISRSSSQLSFCSQYQLGSRLPTLPLSAEAAI